MKRKDRLRLLRMIGVSLLALACEASIAQSDAPFHESLEPAVLSAYPQFASTPTHTPSARYRVSGVIIGVRRVAALLDEGGETHIVTLGEQLPDRYRVKRIDLRRVVLETGTRRLTLRVPR